MKLLSIAGTAAMFLVGGGILVHGLPWLHHAVQGAAVGRGPLAAALLPTLADGLAGLDGVQVEAPHTNIVFVDLTGAAREKSAGLLPHLAALGIQATGLYRLRLVTHLNVDAAGVDRAVAAIRRYFGA